MASTMRVRREPREHRGEIGVIESIETVFWGMNMSFQTLIIVSLVFAGFFIYSAPERSALLRSLGLTRRIGR
jgi:hypothetical protein